LASSVVLPWCTALNEGGWLADGEGSVVYTKGTDELLLLHTSSLTQSYVKEVLDQVATGRTQITPLVDMWGEIIRLEQRARHKGSIWILHDGARSHWRVAMVDKRGECVYLFDPYGTDVEGDMIEAFRGAYSTYEMQQVGVRVQSDGHNCGIWVAWCTWLFASYIRSETTSSYPQFIRERMRSGESGGVIHSRPKVCLQ